MSQKTGEESSKSEVIDPSARVAYYHAAAERKYWRSLGWAALGAGFLGWAASDLASGQAVSGGAELGFAAGYYYLYRDYRDNAERSLNMADALELRRNEPENT